uniref:Reverse transcriptase domain-containing protein n=1 Tax=Tanacetum cinerariifolium TaxID=118510 RepID=A0A6L2J402_TANCI|nr:hypothetical protein [Tanacetum cinerariifolium]
MNYYESNPCYDSNYSGFDQIEPSQYSVNQPLNIQNDLSDHKLFINELIQQKLQKENENAQLFLAIAITLDLPTVEPEDSLRMRDDHLDTILETESNEFIKSSIENLVPNPSESEDECECDVPDCDDSQTTNFSTFSNPLFDDSTSSDDESSHEKGIHEMSFKTYSNPLFDLDEEIISSDFNPNHNKDLDSTLKNDRFDTKSYLLESLLNHDTLMASSPKFDSFVEEFSSELAHTNLIPPGIIKADCDPEEEIQNSDATIESFSPSPISIEDSDSLRDNIDLTLTLGDLMPPGIEDDDYDSEGDILEELLSNNSLSLPKNESFHLDILSSPRPPTKPPDDDEIEPNLGILTVKVVGDIFEHYVTMPRLFPTQPTHYSNKEKSPHLLSHQGIKAFQLSFDSPMMIYGGNIPILDISFLHFYLP